MSKGLDALKEIALWGYQDNEGDLIIVGNQLRDEFKIVRKELIENEEILHIFKNALTIEREPILNVNGIKRDRGNCFTSFISEIIEIRQNELYIELCSKLREWVLKNAFPKELKALNILLSNLSIVEPINDTTLIFDIDLWDSGKQKEDFKFIKEMLDEYQRKH